MFLGVDLTRYILQLWGLLLGVLDQYISVMDSIKLGSIGTVKISLYDFTIAVVVVGMVLGAFLKIHPHDDFYGGSAK